MGEWIITAQPGSEDEVFEFVDPKTRRTVSLPKKLNEIDMKSLIEGVIEKSKTNAKEQYKSQIEELTAKVSDYDDLKNRLSEVETSGLTASQKAAKDAERVAKEAEKHKAEAERLRASLHSEKVNNSVFKALGQTKGLIDINKAATLFNAEAKPKLIEKNGEFLTVAEIDGQELDIAEAYSKWIARDDNKILLQNTLSAGAGSAGGTASIQSKQMNRTDFFAQTPAAQAAFIKDGGKVLD